MLNSHLSLAEGSRIEDFEIRRRLGRGGFGVTYLATEYAPSTGAPEILREVAIKEFFPQGIAVRVENSRVIPSQMEGAEAAFFAALKAFLREAQAVARLDHPNLIRIFRVFESHGTAYFAMPYIRGASLRGVLRAQGGLDQEQIERLILPVLDGLEEAHRQNILHRDIKPDNIMIRDDLQSPILIDFGASRMETAGVAEQYTRLSELAAYTPGYAPIEQYARAATLNRHGPYTDIYAFCALLYECITGRAPPEASLRSLEVQSRRSDPMESPARLATRAYDARLLAAVEWGLELVADDRPQTVTQLRNALLGRIPVPARSTVMAGATARGASATATTIPQFDGAERALHRPTARPSPSVASESPARRFPGSRLSTLMASAMAACFAVVAGATWWLTREPATRSPQEHAASPNPANSPAPAIVAPSVPPAVALIAAVSADRASGIYTQGDPLHLQVSLNRRARLSVFEIDSRDRVRRTYPRTAVENAPLDAGVVRLPFEGGPLAVEMPAGAAQIVVMASVQELPLDGGDLAALQLGTFTRTDLDRVARSLSALLGPQDVAIATAMLEIQSRAQPVALAGSSTVRPLRPESRPSERPERTLVAPSERPSRPSVAAPTRADTVAPMTEGASSDGWILNPAIAGGLAATGCVSRAGNTQIERNAALARARADLARQMQIVVATLDQTLEELSQNGNQSASSFSFQGASSQIAQRALSGARIARVEPATLDGQAKLCAMVVLDANALRRTAQDAAKTAGLEPTPDVIARLTQRLSPR